jgi:hypothetical protein
LAVGNLDRTWHGDLVVWVPGENYGHADAGIVHVLYATRPVWLQTGSERWSQDSGERRDRRGR